MPANPKIYFVPLGLQLITNVPRHMLSRQQTPWAKNFNFYSGTPKKRFGYVEAHDFGGKCLGAKRVSADFMLIAAQETSDPLVTYSRLWEWNMAIDTDALSLKVMRELETLGGSTIAGDPNANWNFASHFDAALGQSIVFCNGVDGLFAYNNDTGLIAQLNAADSDFTPKYLASYYQRLYVAHLNTGTVTDPSGQFRYTASATFDATDWTAANGAFTQVRGEQDGVITGLRTWQDMLVLGKEGMLWQIFPGGEGNKMLIPNRGFEADQSIISSGLLYFSENGQILTFNGSTELGFLSFPVHNNLAGSSPGNWSEIAGVQDTYSRKDLFSTGNRIWAWDEILRTWALNEYDRKIRVLEDAPPFQKFLFQDHEILEFQNIILAEDAILSDIVFCVDDRYLAKQTHSYSDNGTPITCQYDIRWDNCDTDQKKNFRKILIEADMANRSTQFIRVYWDVADAPRQPSFTEANSKRLEINSAGFGEISLSGLNNKYITLRIEESSEERFEIYTIGIDFQPTGYV